MNSSIDLTELYRLRNDFTIIGLTGRSASGVTKVAKFLNDGFNSALLPPPSDLNQTHASYKKYRIVYNYTKENFSPYIVIEYKHVLMMFIIKYGMKEFIDFLRCDEIGLEYEASKLTTGWDFTDEIEKLKLTESEFHDMTIKSNNIDFGDAKNYDNLEKIHSLFFSEKFQKFSSDVHDILKSTSQIKRNKLLQLIANNLRRSGTPYQMATTESNKIFTIVELINVVIKAFRNHCNSCSTQIVIDSLRNPFEIMFFRQRYAAFYIFSVNRSDETRTKRIAELYPSETSDANILFDEEYKGGNDYEFYKQNIRECIQKADIHISYVDKLEVDVLNAQIREKADNTSPFFTWQMQVIKYLALISHPGIVTPSPEERCMQMAYTAKYNSGCISRQVGAAITDEHYSLKAVGWNNTPEGQVPCLLRNAEDLIASFSEKHDDALKRLSEFTPFEKTDEKFREALLSNFSEQIAQNRDKLKGRTVCFCFKSLKNSFSEGKNQVHTRSLHAEESAFLQITKYGGEGISGGKLFTTASPCELCSKKAFQLGIKVIYYIDPYPGISQKQILEAGNERTNPVLRLFNGAIGNAYHWLYEPFMAYKDELQLLLGQEIKDLTTTYREKIEKQDKRIKELEEQLRTKG